jgi:glutathione S-transferase
MEKKMQLYEFAPTRSIRVRWTLQELGVEFESVTINLADGEHRRPEFLKLNPAGRLPVLIDDDFVLTESVAIVLYLAEKYSHKGLLPIDLKQRAQVNRWLLFTGNRRKAPGFRHGDISQGCVAKRSSQSDQLLIPNILLNHG